MVCPQEVRDETGPLQYQMPGRSAGQWQRPSIVLKSRVNKCAAKFVNKSTSQPVDCCYSDTTPQLPSTLTTSTLTQKHIHKFLVGTITIISIYNHHESSKIVCWTISVKKSLFCASGLALLPPFWLTLRRQFAEAPGERSGPPGNRFFTFSSSSSASTFTSFV